MREILGLALGVIVSMGAMFGFLYFFSRRLDDSSQWKEAMVSKMKAVYSKEEVLEKIADHVHLYKEWYFIFGVGVGAIVTYALTHHWLRD